MIASHALSDPRRNGGGFDVSGREALGVWDQRGREKDLGEPGALCVIVYVCRLVVMCRM